MNYRTDIQALRGIAVLLVVFYHAGALPLAGGYLGVDIFFVISGFLITTQIARQLDNGAFSFTQFYLRRAWRLLPAAYAVFAICLLCAPWVLSSIELHDFKQQLAGAITFTANIVLWTQTGYFEEAAELKPLLHTWSLSIEEQYYLIMPALLYWVERKYWNRFVITLTLISLGLMSILISDMPGAIFYLTPTRVWELGIGSVLGLLLLQSNYRTPKWLGGLALLFMMANSIWLIPVRDHTEIYILIATICTAIVIASELRWLNEGIVAKSLAQVGTISYSLYLVHWPIFSFMHSANISGAGLWWPYRAGGLIVSFALAWLLYHYVETRFRILSREHSRKFTPLIVIGALLLLATVLLPSAPDKDYRFEFRANFGLSENCDTAQFSAHPECRTSTTPDVIIWGDSFAMHLTPGLKELSEHGIIQSAKSTCAPVLDVAVYGPPKFTLAWGQGCIDQNQATLDYILANESIKLVVLAAQWHYLLAADGRLAIVDPAQPKKLRVEGMELQQFANKIAELTKLLQSNGKRVVVVDGPPSIGFDIAKCHERLNRSMPSFGGTPDCQFTTAELRRHKVRPDRFLDALKQHNVPIFRFEDHMCIDQQCITKINDTILYRDTGHFSHAGSVLVARRFEILKEMQKIAEMGAQD